MSISHNVNVQEENELQKIFEQIKRNYYLFIIGLVVALGIAFAINRYSIPQYKVVSSVLIKESDKNNPNMGEFINSSLFGTNKNLQNELLILQSYPVISQTVKNLDLMVSYYTKRGWSFLDAYKQVPFKVLYMHNHVQPLGVKLEIDFLDTVNFEIKVKAENVGFYHFDEEAYKFSKDQWEFSKTGKVGQLIETPELSFIIELDRPNVGLLGENKTYFFSFSNVNTLTEMLKMSLQFNIIELEATAIEISYKTNSASKGIDIINGLTNVYSDQNLEKKNYLAKITLEYIDKQLSEISDSLTNSEQTLQRFRSSNKLINLDQQTSTISDQYLSLENQLAELVSKKRYFEYVASNLNSNGDFSNMTVPSSIGIQDPLLNNLMETLLTAQAQKNNLIENRQEKNPQIKRLDIQIENLKKTISENVTYLLKTSDITISEMEKRINKIKAEISLIPNTERQLVGIERKYRLNDAIYNYLMEKRAEANITRASNMPDNEVIEPAKMVGFGPVFPNTSLNYMIAFILGLAIPFAYLRLRSTFNNKIESQEQIERITDIPVLGKILHNNKKSHNVVFEYQNSTIAESFRTLRTNLEYYVRGSHKKVIMVTSCIEGEGKSFNALNIAMSYAQFNRKTILLDFDLRKHSKYFNDQGENLVGLSSYLINKATLEDIIIKSPHNKLDYISSGPIPPNPVELVGLEKTEKLINQLKTEYDYIIIDTPPLAQVTDAYLLIEQADVKVLITRYNYSLKNVFLLIAKDLKMKDIRNVCIVLNDNKVYRDQYGYGYGYSKS